MEIDKRDTSVLQHMVKYCFEVEVMLERHGSDREEFERDFEVRNAMVAPILAILELSTHLSEAFRDAYKTDIPWTELRGMRNTIAHDYQGINWDIVWQTVVNDIPVLHSFCEKILKENGKYVPGSDIVNTY